MIYLLLAVLASIFIFIFFKSFDKWKVDNITAITVNYLCAALLGTFTFSGEVSFSGAYNSSWFYLAVGTGILLVFLFQVYALSTQKIGITITSVAGKMSVVMPVMLGFFIMYDPITWNKIAGITIALIAFWLTFKKKNTEKFNIKYFFLPIFIFFGNGILDSSMKIAQTYYLEGDQVFFLSVAFYVSLITGIIITVVRIVRKKPVLQWKNFFAGIGLGVANWYATYFFLVGLDYFDVSVFVPIFCVSVVTTSTLTGVIIFRERLRFINWIGIGLAILAIGLIAING